MKRLKRILIHLVLFSLSMHAYGQEIESHLLDGTEIEYEYSGLGAVAVTFYDGLVKFKWVSGPSAGRGGQDFIYRARKIDDDTYLVNWHEPVKQDFVSLIINYGTEKVYGSALVRYATEKEKIIFKEAKLLRTTRK